MKEGLIAKNMTEKKTTKRGLCGSRQKDRASPEERGAGIFGGWGFFCKNTGYTRHSSNKFGSALACTVFTLRSCL